MEKPKANNTAPRGPTGRGKLIAGKNTVRKLGRKPSDTDLHTEEKVGTIALETPEKHGEEKPCDTEYDVRTESVGSEGSATVLGGGVPIPKRNAEVPKGKDKTAPSDALSGTTKSCSKNDIIRFSS